MAKSKSASISKKIDFERSLAELEQLVEEMENGELTLDQSLGKFEKGVALTKACQQALQEAEQRVNILMDKNGEATLEEFPNDVE